MIGQVFNCCVCHEDKPEQRATWDAAMGGAVCDECAKTLTKVVSVLDYCGYTRMANATEYKCIQARRGF